MFKKLLLVIALLSVISVGFAVTTLRFTRTDGSFWECGFSAPSPETPTYLGTSSVVGSHTNTFGGHSYTIDSVNDTLLADGQVVGPLIWHDNVVWDVQSHYGFCIDKDGVGWLATLDSDSDNVSFLLQVNLTTGHVTYVDYIEGADLFQINGMIVHRN